MCVKPIFVPYLQLKEIKGNRPAIEVRGEMMKSLTKEEEELCVYH